MGPPEPSPVVGTIIFPVTDLSAAKARFAALLGTAPTVDTPYYVGFRLTGQDIGLDPSGHAHGMTGPVAYLSVPDIEAARADLMASGAQELSAVRDVGGGKLIAILRDPDGNLIGLLQQP